MGPGDGALPQLKLPATLRPDGGGPVPPAEPAAAHGTQGLVTAGASRAPSHRCSGPEWALVMWPEGLQRGLGALEQKGL